MMVYISGALKASRDLARARALYESVAEIVTLAGHIAYLPHQFTDPEYAVTASPVQVFQRDLAALRSADGVLAFLGEPSLGVGAEIAICTQAKTPLLGLHRPGDDVSRFAVGLLEAAGARLVCYANAIELEAAIHKFLEEVNVREVSRGAARTSSLVLSPTL